ncbi:hypothetical protein [Lentibacillus salicampi]|uniref:hypothetical protein n=1 Tax=Lentibacillus salicampi TaxID=175306 RepID=UPI00142F57B1|nr:hypothetical protein [Lentibacillus salicampi]
MTAKYGDHQEMPKRRRKQDRGCIADLLLSVPELIIWAFKWLFRGIGALFRHWS